MATIAHRLQICMIVWRATIPNANDMVDHFTGGDKANLTTLTAKRLNSKMLQTGRAPLT